jgi:hypothetical protein
MKHPLPRIQSAVPRTLHAQLEIAKAIRTLMGPDEDEVLRQRRAEIAAIRHDIEALARDIPKTFEEASALVKAELRAALRKYSPDQPRVPAGNRDGGQWTSGGKAGESRANNEANVGVADRSQLSEEECDFQFERDLAVCRVVRIPACYGQAMARYAACRNGRPIPPFNF